MQNFNLSVDAKPAVISANFDEVSEKLSGFLDHYRNLVVGHDDVKSAKEDMAYLNKVSKEINAVRKAKVDIASAPIIEFTDNVKSLLADISSAREHIKSQVEKYESETKLLIKESLEFYREGALADAGVRVGFAEVPIDDLVVLGSFTSSQKLTKKAKESIDGRVHACLNKQMKVDNRILQLENESYRAGLDSPLTRDHVAGFLATDDDSYYADRLKQLIDSELRRQEAIKEKMEAKHKQELEDAKAPNPPEPQPSPKSSPSSKEYDVRICVARFEVEVPAGVDDEKIVSRMKDRLKETPLFEHLHSVEVI